MLDKLIFDYQNVFVCGRKTLDLVLTENECMDCRIKSPIPRVICKLDIEKAYNHVNLDLGFYLLERIDLGKKWKGWIHASICNVWFSVLINGSPVSFLVHED